MLDLLLSYTNNTNIHHTKSYDTQHEYNTNNNNNGVDYSEIFSKSS